MLEFNKYLEFYEGYSQGILEKNPSMAESNARKLFRNKTIVANFRNNLFNKTTGESYHEHEKKKIRQDFNSFEKFFQKLSISDQEELQKQLTSFEDENKNDDFINLPIVKLKSKADFALANNQTKISNNNPMETERQKEDNPKYRIEINNIHSKDSNLFEIIHAHYLKFFQSNLNE